jgi:hypothetical protein
VCLPIAPQVGPLLAVAGEARVEGPVRVVAGERDVGAVGGVRGADRDDLAVWLERDRVRYGVARVEARPLLAGTVSAPTATILPFGWSAVARAELLRDRPLPSERRARPDVLRRRPPEKVGSRSPGAACAGAANRTPTTNSVARRTADVGTLIRWPSTLTPLPDLGLRSSLPPHLSDEALLGRSSSRRCCIRESS